VAGGTITERDDGILIQSREANSGHAVLQIYPHVRVEGRVVVEVDQPGHDRLPGGGNYAERRPRLPVRRTCAYITDAIPLNENNSLRNRSRTAAVDEGRALDDERVGFNGHRETLSARRPTVPRPSRPRRAPMRSRTQGMVASGPQAGKGDARTREKAGVTG